MSLDGSILYHKKDNGTWSQHQLQKLRNKFSLFAAVGAPCEQPYSYKHATVHRKHEQFICSESSEILSLQVNTDCTFDEFLQWQDSSIQWCSKYMVPEAEGIFLKEAVQTGEAIAVCDGFYQDSYGTASWVIEGVTPGIRAQGCVLSPGGAKIQSAYRSELSGILAIMIVAQLLCDYYHIWEGSIELGCDGLAALNKTFTMVYLIDTDESNQDLLMVIRTLWNRSPLPWKIRHVKGHQDDDQDYESLDRWARLNIEMDKNTKKFISVAKRQPSQHLVPFEPWSIWINCEKLVSNISTKLYEHVHSRQAIEYWAAKPTMTKNSLAIIDWTTINKAMSLVKHSRWVFISKHSSWDVRGREIYEEVETEGQ